MIKEAGWAVKASNCQFAVNKVKYLGHLLGGGEIIPDLSKVQVIQEWSRPSTKRQIRAFIGVVAYYRRFIPDFSTIAAPLCEHTKKMYSDVVIWTPECQLN